LGYEVKYSQAGRQTGRQAGKETAMQKGYELDSHLLFPCVGGYWDEELLDHVMIFAQARAVALFELVTSSAMTSWPGISSSLRNVEMCLG